MPILCSGCALWNVARPSALSWRIPLQQAEIASKNKLGRLRMAQKVKLLTRKHSSVLGNAPETLLPAHQAPTPRQSRAHLSILSSITMLFSSSFSFSSAAARANSLATGSSGSLLPPSSCNLERGWISLWRATLQLPCHVQDRPPEGCIDCDKAHHMLHNRNSTLTPCFRAPCLQDPDTALGR